MAIFSAPFLTTYDPPGSSEGTIDPLGLYQIADQLATKLVPSVRERMQRVRFLTAMSVGALVTEGLEVDPEKSDTPPFLIWEWLVIESLIRTMDGEADLFGVPGIQVTRRAMDQHKYLDDRSYLKTPRIFGFHGVYKRLAIHLGLVDTHLKARTACEHLADAWAKDRGYGGLSGAKKIFDHWRSAVQRSMNQTPSRTHTYWNNSDWEDLAEGFVPGGARRREKRCLRNQLLLLEGERSLGALPGIWKLQDEFEDSSYNEESLQMRLKDQSPEFTMLLDAIRKYERFCRSLEDAFDMLRSQAAASDFNGLDLESIVTDVEFHQALSGLDRFYEESHFQLGEVDPQLMSLFDDRFSRFAQPMDDAELACELCEHHEKIQQDKSAGGKRAWFDRLGDKRIYIRHGYRIDRPVPKPTKFVHGYRGTPIRKFWQDLK